MAEHGEEFLVADQTPALLERGEISRRNLAGKAVYIDVAPEARNKLRHKVQISVQGELVEVLPPGAVFLLHPCALDYLQLVELDACLP